MRATPVIWYLTKSNRRKGMKIQIERICFIIFYTYVLSACASWWVFLLYICGEEGWWCMHKCSVTPATEWGRWSWLPADDFRKQNFPQTSHHSRLVGCGWAFLECRARVDSRTHINIHSSVMRVEYLFCLVEILNTAHLCQRKFTYSWFQGNTIFYYLPLWNSFRSSNNHCDCQW